MESNNYQCTCRSFSSSLIANQNVASNKENIITFHTSDKCVPAPCSHAQKTKDSPKKEKMPLKSRGFKRKQQGCDSAPGLKWFCTYGPKTCIHSEHHSADTALHWRAEMWCQLTEDHQPGFLDATISLSSNSAAGEPVKFTGKRVTPGFLTSLLRWDCETQRLRTTSMYFFS